MSGGLRHHNDEEKRARAMRLDTESSKQDRYDRKQTSARALMENHAHCQEKSFSLHLDIADVVRDVERAIKMGKALIVVARISETHRLDFDKRC